MSFIDFQTVPANFAVEHLHVATDVEICSSINYLWKTLQNEQMKVLKILGEQGERNKVVFI